MRDFQQYATGEQVSQHGTPFGAEYATLSEAIEQLEQELRAFDNKVRDMTRFDPSVKNTPEWYVAVQERKNMRYKINRLKHDRAALLPEDIRRAQAAEEDRAEERYKKERQAKWESWKAAQGEYDYHPAVNTRNERYYRSTIAAFSGFSDDDITERVAEYQAQGYSTTEAYRAVWGASPLRTDKPLIALDLEVASSTWGGNVDTGPYSSILEVGYIQRNPDGTEERESYLCGVPEDFLITDGTGAQAIHNITPAMVAGMTPFNDDAPRMISLRNRLRGSVLVAHNARYEVSQFEHNLPGFNKMLAQGDIEVLDTRNVSSFYLPDTPTNTNEDFVKAAGIEYVGAHRALEDAEMTLRALLRHKGIK